MKNRTKPLVIKICISVISLFLFLGVLEISLRIAGNILIKQRIDSSLLGEESVIKERTGGEIPPLSDKDKIILCLGDSQTYGGNLLPQETYPYFLNKILNERHPEEGYRVINGGVCEYNSKQVLTRLPALAEKYNPKIIILLVGSADYFNFAGYSLSESGINNIFANLRVFKMFKIIVLNIKSKIISLKAKAAFNRDKNLSLGFDGFALVKREKLATSFQEKKAQIKVITENQPLVDKAWYYYNKGQKMEAINTAEEALKANPSSVEILCSLAYFNFYVPEFNLPPPYYDEKNIKIADRLYSEALHIQPNSEFVLSNLSFFYNRIIEDYVADKKYEFAVELLCKALELDPTNHEMYIFLLKTYELQNKYDANYIIAFFEKMLSNNPDLINNNLFMNYLSFFKDKKKCEKEINQKLNENLNLIAEYAEKNNIKLIIQSYPSNDRVNKILRRLAFKRSLTFVDNIIVFRKLWAKEGRGIYERSDGHVNAKGNRVIAENLYNYIFK